MTGRTQIPGSQILDGSVKTTDIEDNAVTDAKLSATGVAASSFTKVTTNTKGRIIAGENPSTLAGYGITDAAPVAPSFITVNSEVTLPNERQLIGTSNQIALTDGGGNSTLALSLPSTLIAPGSLQFSTNFAYATETLSAAGSTQATATPITKAASIVTAGAVLSGVRLPAPSFVGEIHVVTNKNANEIYVYPHSGGSIVTGVTDEPTFINPFLAITFVWDGSTWTATAFSVAAGNTGIDVTYDLGNVIISNLGVLSLSGGTTGLLVSSATGDIVLSGTLQIANGGTGASSTTAAFNNLSPATIAGDLIYFNGTNNVRLPIGSNTNVLSISGGAPTWVTQASINAGTAVTATTATNLAGGGAGQVAYQTAAGTTAFTAAGTSNQVLSGGTTPTFVSTRLAIRWRAFSPWAASR